MGALSATGIVTGEEKDTMNGALKNLNQCLVNEYTNDMR